MVPGASVVVVVVVVVSGTSVVVVVVVVLVVVGLSVVGGASSVVYSDPQYDEWIPKHVSSGLLHCQVHGSPQNVRASTSVLPHRAHTVL